MSENKPGTIITPRMLEDAVFTRAEEDSEYDIWVTTADGGMHGMLARDAIPISTQGGDGPDRFRKWLIINWFPTWLEKSRDESSNITGPESDQIH